MKRFAALMLLLCLLLLTVPVQGAELHSWDVQAAVKNTGETTVTAEAVVRLDAPTNELVFPLGTGAKDLTVNGISLKIKKVDGVPSAVVKSEAGFSGTLKFTLCYTLRNCLDTKGQWDLVLPLVADNSPHTVQQLSFRVTLPGKAAMPTFQSGYRGEDVDNYLNLTLDDNVIVGTVSTELRDHENLILIMKTDPTVFPRVGQMAKLGLWCAIGAAVFWVLALVYWFFFLRWCPFRTVKQTRIPAGIHCGQVGSQLLAQNPDTALTVLSWAKAGYLTIHVNRDRAVILHKRMAMGHERSRWEQKLFRGIFGRGNMAEVSSIRFQTVRAKADSARPQVKKLFQGGGIPALAKLLTCICGGLLWAIMGNALLSSGVIRIILTIVMGLVGIAASWLMQGGFRSIFSWDKRPGILALICASVTLLLGIFSGRFLTCIFVLLSQTIMGFLLVFGGKRSPAGRNAVQSILSFRKFLRHFGSKRVNRMIRMDPGYYYQVAPYALALGVDRSFAKMFSQVQLPECSWLITDEPGDGQSMQWYLLLRRVTETMRGR